MAEIGEQRQRQLRIPVSYKGYCKNSCSTEGAEDTAMIEYMKILDLKKLGPSLKLLKNNIMDMKEIFEAWREKNFRSL